jgi:hypothetical protein
MCKAGIEEKLDYLANLPIARKKTPEKNQRADKTLILRQIAAFQFFEQLATLLLGTRLPHDLATMARCSLALRYRTVPIRV